MSIYLGEELILKEITEILDEMVGATDYCVGNPTEENASEEYLLGYGKQYELEQMQEKSYE